MIGIYKIENLVNGKVYIGQSTDIEKRWIYHRRDLRHNHHRNSHLQYAWNKYGESNFNHVIIEECKLEELNNKEKEYIKLYDSTNRKYGYNITIGGDGTSIINTILQFDKFGNLIREWDNGIIASQETNINASGIYGCLNHKYWCIGNYIWLYKKEYEQDQNILKIHTMNVHNKPIKQYDLYGNLIKIWNSQVDIIKELNINPVQCCTHERKTVGDFIFLYYDDPFELTEDYLSNVRESNKRLKQKHFYQVDENCNIIKEYFTIREACRDGYTLKMISDCLCHKRDKYKNYIWITVDEYDNLTKEQCYQIIHTKQKNKKHHGYIQYDLDGNKIKEYNNVKELKNDGFCYVNVCENCRNESRQYKGYIWKYKD